MTSGTFFCPVFSLLTMLVSSSSCLKCSFFFLASASTCSLNSFSFSSLSSSEADSQRWSFRRLRRVSDHVASEERTWRANTKTVVGKKKKTAWRDQRGGKNPSSRIIPKISNTWTVTFQTLFDKNDHNLTKLTHDKSMCFFTPQCFCRAPHHVRH